MGEVMWRDGRGVYINCVYLKRPRLSGSHPTLRALLADAMPRRPSIAIALHDYESGQPDELPLRRGDQVRILAAGEPGWAAGEHVEQHPLPSGVAGGIGRGGGHKQGADRCRTARAQGGARRLRRLDVAPCS